MRVAREGYSPSGYPRSSPPYARKTVRLNDVIELVGFALGGEAGERLAKRLGLWASPSTLLQHLRGAKISSSPAPMVIGVDDFAFLKGNPGVTGRSKGTSLAQSS
jgi:hypothetical protein